MNVADMGEQADVRLIKLQCPYIKEDGPIDVAGSLCLPGNVYRLFH